MILKQEVFKICKKECLRGSPSKIGGFYRCKKIQYMISVIAEFYILIPEVGASNKMK
jgi:hypothetical protein